VIVAAAPLTRTGDGLGGMIKLEAAVLHVQGDREFLLKHFLPQSSPGWPTRRPA
jgi:hypothetical protein